MEEWDNEAFYKRMQTAAFAKGMTLPEAMRAAGYTSGRNDMSRYTKHGVLAQTLRDYCAAVGCPADWLLGLDGERAETIRACEDDAEAVQTALKMVGRKIAELERRLAALKTNDLDGEQ